MKIDATCGSCDRTFLLSQIGPESDAPGRCPFCGHRFARHYSPLLVETVASAELAAGNFVHVISQLQGLETGFHIDLDGLLKRVFAEVHENERLITSA